MISKSYAVDEFKSLVLFAAPDRRCQGLVGVETTAACMIVWSNVGCKHPSKVARQLSKHYSGVLYHHEDLCIR
jgi:hypothetical protein